MQDDSGADGTYELLGNIKRLTRIVLDRLEDGSKSGTLDQAQIRLYGSIITRSLCLWLEVLNPRPRRRVGHDVHDEIDRLYGEILHERESAS